MKKILLAATLFLLTGCANELPKCSEGVSCDRAWTKYYQKLVTQDSDTKKGLYFDFNGIGIRQCKDKEHRECTDEYVRHDIVEKVRDLRAAQAAKGY